MSDLALMNASMNAATSDQLSPSATTSTASTAGIESFLSSSASSLANCMLPQSDEAVLGGMGANIDEKEDRPSLSYKDLIIEAIESSPEKRLKLSEIYQVIKYLHPYYRKRPDQWGWQNSIRHNLSLHDCFVKLPLKQSSASGVVGHFWTVIRDREEKNGSSRRRNRGSSTRLSRNGCKISNASAPGGSTSHNGKGKDRQSVSSDSGVLSDESQSSSPTVMQIPDFANPFLTAANYGTLNFPAQLHRPMPSYTAPAPAIPSSPTKPTTGLMDNASTSLLPLLGRIALQSMMDNTTNSQMSSPNSISSGLQRLQLLQLLYQQNLLQQLTDEQSTSAFPRSGLGASPVASLLTQILLNSNNSTNMDMGTKMSSQPLLDLILQSSGSLPQQAINSHPFGTNFDLGNAATNGIPNLSALFEQQIRNSMSNVATMNSPTPSAKDVVMI